MLDTLATVLSRRGSCRGVSDTRLRRCVFATDMELLDLAKTQKDAQAVYPYLNRQARRTLAKFYRAMHKGVIHAV